MLWLLSFLFQFFDEAGYALSRFLRALDVPLYRNVEDIAFFAVVGQEAGREVYLDGFAIPYEQHGAAVLEPVQRSLHVEHLIAPVVGAHNNCLPDEVSYCGVTVKLLPSDVTTTLPFRSVL